MEVINECTKDWYSLEDPDEYKEAQKQKTSVYLGGIIVEWNTDNENFFSVKVYSFID